MVDLEVTPYYHCVARCVRRAFLCGHDHYSGKSFEHRRAWVVERIKLLARVFAIDVCAYAVMSNHLHLVLRVDQQRVAGWSDEEVVSRARQLFRSVFDGFDEMDTQAQRRILTKWRERLASLSWFMRCLNEWLARRANREDGCKGRFWEGRFKSQALLDDGAVLACMSYVDLNPVRAGIADSLSDSDFTSAQARLLAVAEAHQSQSQQPTTPVGLAPLVGERKRHPEQPRLAISLLDYLELLEWTGRAARHDKQGQITGPPSKLLAQAGLNPESWLDAVHHLGAQTWDVVGSRPSIEDTASGRDLRWRKGISWATHVYHAA